MGAWIFIDLNTFYNLSYIILRRRYTGSGYDYKAEVKGILLQTSDGKRKKNDNLPRKEIIPLKSSFDGIKSINITVTAVFNSFTTSSEKSQIGFSEITFCGSKTKGSLRYGLI